MKYLTVLIPSGVALQQWAIPGTLSLEYRLLFNKSNAVVVRDWLCKLANEATELALVSIAEESEMLQLQNEQKRARSIPSDKSELANLKSQQQRITDQQQFVPMNPTVEIPETMLNPQPAPAAKTNVVKDNGQDFDTLKIRS